MRHFIFWLVLSVLLYFGIEIAFGHSDPAWYSIAYAVLISFIVTMFFGSMILNVLLGEKVQRAFTSGNWLRTSLSALVNSTERLFGKKKLKKKVSRTASKKTVPKETPSSIGPALEWLGVALVFTGITYFWGYEVTLSTLLALGMVLVGLFELSKKTEWGPFTQLPNNRWLRVKAGLAYVGYYVNAENVGVTKDGKVYTDKGQYQKRLRSGPMGFIFRKFGMVYTGIPYFNGVRGMNVIETELDFKQASDGSVQIKVPKKDPIYFTAPPLFVRRAISYGGIPIEGANLVDFGIASTLMITNLLNIGTILTDEGPFIALKGTLESALRPEVEKMSLEEVLRIRTEFLDKSKLSDKKQLAGKVIALTNTGIDRFGYGLKIYDLDIPVIGPSDKEYGAAERKKKLNEALAQANTVEYSNKADQIRTLGKATADARRELMEASGDPTTALVAEGMGKLQPHVTFIWGNSTGVTVPVGQQPSKP